jgi:toxin ParE1/3/4
MSSIHLRPLAEQDLNNIWLYSFQNWGEAQADQYFDQLSKAIELLGSAPMMSYICQEFTPPVRIHHHASHLIIYVASVEIIRILHESLGIQALLE